jgi:hypothetical protein
MVTLPRLIFLLALVDHDVASKVERNGGAIQGDRGRPSDIGPIQQKIAAMTGTFNTTWKVSCNLLNLRKQFIERLFRVIFVNP